MSQRLRPRADVRFRIIDHEAVVLRQEAGETLVLNEVGARVLSLLADGTNLEHTADILAREFTVERERAHADVLSFVAELQAAGVLEGSD